MDITFEWDAAKASLNKKKHNVSFDEAKTVFFDENAIVIRAGWGQASSVLCILSECCNRAIS